MLITDCIKAFDKVNHERVLKELNHYGKVDQNFISFISNRRQRQRLILDQAQSGEMEFDLGVPQGSVLGPCLLSSLHVQCSMHDIDMPNIVSSTVQPLLIILCYTYT